MDEYYLGVRTIELLFHNSKFFFNGRKKKDLPITVHHLNHRITLCCGITWVVGLAITQTHNFKLANVISHKDFLLLGDLP